jgi:hypothetical protein
VSISNLFETAALSMKSCVAAGGLSAAIDGRHVVQRDLEPAVELVKLLLVRDSLVRVFFEGVERASQLCDGQTFIARTSGSLGRTSFAFCFGKARCGMMTTHDQIPG